MNWWAPHSSSKKRLKGLLQKRCATAVVLLPSHCCGQALCPARSLLEASQVSPRFLLRHQDCFSRAAMEPCPRPGSLSKVSAQLTDSRSLNTTAWDFLVGPRRPPSCTVLRWAAAWWLGIFFHTGMLDIVSPKLMSPDLPGRRDLANSAARTPCSAAGRTN